MLLRNNQLVNLGKQGSVVMPPQHRPVFEEGCAIVFSRWTALQLGVDNEWGGPDSRKKAQQALEEVINWFYTDKGQDMNDLEDFLDEVLQMDFNIQAEDGSPYQARGAARRGAPRAIAAGAARRQGGALAGRAAGTPPPASAKRRGGAAAGGRAARPGRAAGGRAAPPTPPPPAPPPPQVARSLVNMHTQVAAGDYSYVHHLRSIPSPSTAACQREANGLPEADEESSSSDSGGEGGEEAATDAQARWAPGTGRLWARGAAAGRSSLSAAGKACDQQPGGEDMEMDDAPPAAAPQQPQQPQVDADGFQVVQRKGRGRR
eukprot:scaffold6.g2522.t1